MESMVHTWVSRVEMWKQASHLSQWKRVFALPTRHSPHPTQWWMSDWVQTMQSEQWLALKGFPHDLLLQMRLGCCSWLQ
jgi:hypothetical protein